MLTYFGHSSFLWTSAQHVRLLIDPFQNPSADVPGSFRFEVEFPVTSADVALITHDHYDHNAVHKVAETTAMLRGPGFLRHRDVSITGAQDIHAGRSGLAGLKNTLFALEVNGVKYCHIGDNRHDAPQEILAEIGEVDVLMITVDDTSHLLTFAQVNELIARMSPKVVVPMHYQQHAITIPSPALGPISEWLSSQQNVRIIGASSLDITRADLPGKCEIWTFEPLLPNGTA